MWLWLLAFVTGDRWQVIRVTRGTWHGTHNISLFLGSVAVVVDRWHKTRDVSHGTHNMCHMTHEEINNCTYFLLFLSVSVCYFPFLYWCCYTLKWTLSVIIKSETNQPNGSKENEKLSSSLRCNSWIQQLAGKVRASRTSASTTPVQDWPDVMGYYEIYNRVHQQSNHSHWMMRAHTKCAHSLTACGNRCYYPHTSRDSVSVSLTSVSPV